MKKNGWKSVVSVADGLTKTNEYLKKIILAIHNLDDK